MELKRCPFCWGEVEIVTVDIVTGETIPFDIETDNSLWFRCYGCDTDFYHDEPFRTVAEMYQRNVDWWNRRSGE